MIRDELLPGQIRTIQISPGNSISADEKLSRHADRGRLVFLIDNINPGIGDRAAYQNRPAFSDLMTG